GTHDRGEAAGGEVDGDLVEGAHRGRAVAVELRGVHRPGRRGTGRRGSVVMDRSSRSRSLASSAPGRDLGCVDRGRRPAGPDGAYDGRSTPAVPARGM